ncbi:hypothetical protein [Sphingomonas jaspsi]|uniref:hypothetical protein n=1 Tax=Sphingomonas jaspsi TaxID=392409 RepID=UPI0012EC769D|nr:hypothetical protein [Sphingomonas jaspsi]
MALFMMAAGALAAIAIACGGDWSYESKWAPQNGIAMLSPSNDTRSNLILLMADRSGTEVAQPAKMTGWIPIEMSWDAFKDRLFPAPPAESDATEQATGAQPYVPGSDYGSSSNYGLCYASQPATDQFVDAVTKDRAVPAREATILVATRKSLAAACDKAKTLSLDLGGVTSPAGRGYAAYLEGSRLFYAEQFDEAAAHFARAADGKAGWASETGRYMIFRNGLLAAIDKNLDEYGSLDVPLNKDRAALDAADAARLAYLRVFPNGRYAASATGLSRRVAWLRGDEAAMSGAYAALLRDSSRRGALPNLDVITEIDRRLFPAKSVSRMTDPVLLAVADLKRLRAAEFWDTDRQAVGPLLTRADLEKQRPVFAAEPELYSYLLAAEAFFGRNKPAEVLALIPDSAHQQRFSYLQFSRQMLRGLALTAVKDRNARVFWVSLLPGATQPYQRGAVELAIYKFDHDAGVAGRLLESGSPIAHPLLRSRIIEIDANAAELRRLVKDGKTRGEREIALYMLVGNDLHYGQYRDFLADQLLIAPALKNRPAKRGDINWTTESYDAQWTTEMGEPPIEEFAIDAGATKGCPTLRTTVGALAANPGAIRPLLCLAEFRRGGYDSWDEHYDRNTGSYVANRRSGYAGQPLTRARIYQLVMDSPAASDDDKAFALNRAIRCYEPSGNNDCGGDVVPKATRKAWFQRLKTRFGNSIWAKELKYYW